MSVCVPKMLSEALRKAARAISRCAPDLDGFIDIDRFNDAARGEDDGVVLHLDVVAHNPPTDGPASSLWASVRDKLPPPIEGNSKLGNMTSTGFRKYIESIIDYLGEQKAWDVMLTSYVSTILSRATAFLS